MSQGHSEKAHAATVQTDGSNLVYCATIMYTCIYKGGKPKECPACAAFSIHDRKDVILDRQQMAFASRPYGRNHPRRNEPCSCSCGQRQDNLGVVGAFPQSVQTLQNGVSD